MGGSILYSASSLPKWFLFAVILGSLVSKLLEMSHASGFETASDDVKGDINKAVKNLMLLREKLQGITERYQNVQQHILETFLERGELRKPGEPTQQPND